jgi:hypothetical protein
MARKSISPRIARWLVRGFLLVCAALWWLLAQSTGAFADDSPAASPTATEDSPVGAVTDTVADLAGSTVERTTHAVRRISDEPTVAEVLPHVTEPVLHATTDLADAAATSVSDTVRTAGETLESLPVAGAASTPDVPAEPSGADSTTTTSGPVAPATAPSSGHRSGDRHVAAARGPRDDVRKHRVRHEPAAAMTAAQVLSRHDSHQRTGSPAATIGGSRPAGWPTAPLPRLGDDAGQTVQGAGGSGAAASALVVTALFVPASGAHIRMPSSPAAPRTRPEEPGTTPD